MRCDPQNGTGSTIGSLVWRELCPCSPSHMKAEPFAMTQVQYAETCSKTAFNFHLLRRLIRHGDDRTTEDIEKFLFAKLCSRRPPPSSRDLNGIFFGVDRVLETWEVRDSKFENGEFPDYNIIEEKKLCALERKSYGWRLEPIWWYHDSNDT